LSAEATIQQKLHATPCHWLVTGGAGFIGSHLVETLLRYGQQVTTLDNLSTGSTGNQEQVQHAVGAAAWSRHRFVRGDVSNLDTCRQACAGVQFVLHQAALGSVPRSLEDPLLTHLANVTGFANMLVAARDAGVSRFVYASSSAVYGDAEQLPKVEPEVGRQLSPYALSKYVDELYADVFARCYGVEAIGLRYFNVFGARQDPQGPYAAVIPRWVRALIRGERVSIFGDGETSRDFCYVANAVQANLLAALADVPAAVGQVYNVAFGDRTSLNTLFEALRRRLADHLRRPIEARPTYEPFRPGDVRHSQADIGKARRLLGYDPQHDLARGLDEALPWYVAQYLDTASATQPQPRSSPVAVGAEHLRR